MHWVMLAFGAALSWGVYGATLHRGQVLLASPLRALLCVGVAYFLVGVLVPAAALAAQGELRNFNTAGTFGTTGRGDFIGPNLRTLDVALTRRASLQQLGGDARVEFRLEVFNLLNRPNFAVPDRVVFAASTSGDAPLPTAGRITRTITSARQLQLGVKLLF